MSRPTRGSNARRLADLEAGAGGTSSPGPDLDRLMVDCRDADPSERPEGMSFDAEADPPRLAYDFWEAQRDCLNRLASDGADIVAFLAGYGSGKSMTGARWLLMSALQYPGSRFLAMGQSFSEARHSTFQVLFNALPGDRTAVVTSAYNGPETSPIVTDYNRSEHRLTLANDSVIILGSADKWNRHAGEEFGGLWLDEPSHYGEDLHDLLEMLGGRLRGVAGPKTMCWTLTGNGYNAAWEILEKREDANGEPIGLNIDVVRASALDNPYLHESDKDRLRRQFAGTGREEQALFGGFAAAQGLVYSAFTRESHVIPHSEARERVDPDWRVYGYDAGWNDPRVLLEVGKTSYDQLVVLDEFYRRDTHVEDAIAWLRSNDKPRGPIYCEHEPAEIRKFKSAGWRAERADKSLDAGIAEVRKRFSSEGNLPAPETGRQTYSGTKPHLHRAGSPSFRESSSSSDSFPSPTGPNEGTEFGSPSDTDTGREGPSRVGLLVSDRCEHLIRELLSYKEEDVEKSGAPDHAADSLRYCVNTLSTSSANSGKRPRVIRTDPW